jgi:hypothetical protein
MASFASHKKKKKDQMHTRFITQDEQLTLCPSLQHLNLKDYNFAI